MGFVIDDLNLRWPAAEVPYEVKGSDFPPGSEASLMIQDAFVQFIAHTIRFDIVNNGMVVNMTVAGLKIKSI